MSLKLNLEVVFLVFAVVGLSAGQTSNNSISRLLDLAEDMFLDVEADIKLQKISSWTEDFVSQCHERGIEMEYEGLKMDLTKCVSTDLAALTDMFRHIDFSFIARSIITGSRNLTEKDKTSVSTRILAPFCGGMKNAWKECESPEYTFMTTFVKTCHREEMSDMSLFYATYIGDVCRNNGSWIFDVLEAIPLKCDPATQNASQSQSDQEKECRRAIDQEPNPDTKFCACCTAHFLVDCSEYLYLNPCGDPEPAQIIFNTFSDIRSFLAKKCSSASSLLSWSSTSAMMLVMLTPNLLAQLLTKI